MDVSVVIPTHNPNAERLRRTLDGLRRQTLPPGLWECLLVDNASTSPVQSAALTEFAPARFRCVREETLGLTSARRRGIAETAGPLIVFVDDDNVLAPDYLEKTISLFREREQLGAAGGRSLPQFDGAPQPWHGEFFSLLALRDLGDQIIIASSRRPEGATRNVYPRCAPIGAGMAVRRTAIMPWLAASDRRLSDRKGTDLSSAGDNDIILTIMAGGWAVGYFPCLTLHHLIPASRLAPDYLARLNYGIQKSWMQVLRLHDANPWPTINGLSAGLRKAKAWLDYRPWQSPAARVRWRGACGHFDGRIA